MDEKLAAAKEGARREVAAIDAAYAAGEVGAEAWHAAMASLVVPKYLAAETPEGGSGSSRDASGWEYARSLIAGAVSPGQTFLDIGCANGHLSGSETRPSGSRRAASTSSAPGSTTSLAVAGRSERPHPHPQLAYKAFWIDS